MDSVKAEKLTKKYYFRDKSDVNDFILFKFTVKSINSILFSLSVQPFNEG